MNIAANCSDLDSINVPLEGINLIEAAAGTGKTYNIQNLVARMIVECNYPIDSIAVVTFTDLAAKELSERLRAVLESLHTVMQNRRCSDQGDQERAEKLVARFNSQHISGDVQLQRLKNALRDFDNNQVSTIHGFCARILRENAFESSLAFQVKLEENDKYLEKLLADYCRTRRYSRNQLPSVLDLSVKSLKDNTKLLLNRPNMQLEISILDAQTTEADLFAEVQQFIGELQAIPDAAGVVRNIPAGLNMIKKMKAQEFLAKQADALQKLLNNATGSTADEYWHVLENLTTSFLSGHLPKRGQQAVPIAEYLENEPLFALAEDFCNTLMPRIKLFLLLQSVEFVRTHLEEWKKRDNFQSYDDLLNNVERALQNQYMRAVLQNKFNAAIIDEFQDTDPVQYAIFRRIFMEDRPNSSFFMVGDPRQAIYSFRGGDLATYLKARSEADKIYQLACNYRSSGAVIKAFNDLFCHGDFFAASGLTPGVVTAPENVKPGLYYQNSEVRNPIQVFYDRQMSQEKLEEKCAQNILELLQNKEYQLPGKDGTLRSVQPGDIAVLAFDKAHLNDIRELLTQYNIPTVCEYKHGIWNSQQASELQIFLTAVLECGNSARLREALLTNLCGVNAAELDLDQLDQQEEFHSWRMQFMQLQNIWRKSGIAAMLSQAFLMQWSNKKSFKVRVAALKGGERIIANFVQLGDLLAAAERESHLAPRGVLNYLAAQSKKDDSEDENAEMLESDRTAVKLMTIHTSKGLQFPIVFLPLMAARYPFKREGLKTFHRGYQLCCNPDNSDPAATALAKIEEMQEIMRLTYVAVTRACSACFISWGKSTSSTSAMDWIFRMKQIPAEESAEILRGFLKLQDDFSLPEVEIPGTLQRTLLTEESSGNDFYRTPLDERELSEPEAVSNIGNSFRLLSYSALNFNSSDVDPDEFTDYDDCDDENSSSSENTASTQLTGGIWDIPGGAAIGNAWHKILEVTDFTCGVQRSEVQKILHFYNFDETAYIDGTCRMLEKLLQLPLDKNGLTLNMIKTNQKFNEFEFLLGAPNGINMQKVLQIVEGYLQEEFGSTYRSQSDQLMQKGFFTGFIDLLFEYQDKLYIVDWKSNTLDRLAENFYGDKLKQAMFEATYPMQYLCYTAAVVRYLEYKLHREIDEELYERHFGGVYYIFLRGIVLDEPGGIFSARPPLKIVKQLLKALSSMEAEQ